MTPAPPMHRYSLPSSGHRLDRTRVDIMRAAVRVTDDESKPCRANTFFVMKVYDGSDYHIIEQSWSAFRELKTNLLLALAKGHKCRNGPLCAQLHGHLKHNFDRPKSANLRMWLQLRLRPHKEVATALFLQHFQDLLDTLLVVLRQDTNDCAAFAALRAVFARFIAVRPPTVLEAARCSIASSVLHPMCA